MGTKRDVENTIAGMRRAIANYPNSSDTDEPYLQPSNRGHKLKRKSVHAVNGSLGNVTGTKHYKMSVEHGGYQRYILKRNPLRYDENGRELGDSSSDEEADARLAEENPYAEIQLQNLLMPLVSAASLPEHPSMSVAYTSPVLTNMAQHACEMAQRERRTLANAKRLMTKLRGDETWIPCGLLHSEKDDIMFDTSKIYKNVISCKPPHRAKRYTERTLSRDEATSESLPDSRKSSSSKTEVGSANKPAKDAKQEPNSERKIGLAKAVNNEEAFVEGLMNDKQRVVTPTHNQKDDDVLMKDQQTNNESRIPGTTEISREGEASNSMTGAMDLTRPQQDGPKEVIPRDPPTEGGDGKSPANSHSSHSKLNGNGVPAALATSENPLNAYLPSPDAEQPEDSEPEEGNGSQVHPQAAPRRMRTRAQAQATSEPTMSSRNESPESFVPPEIHPLFMIPESAIPDKNLGLPPNEAEETRRLLNTYVQKQEEITRGAEKLYDSLLRADRERKEVLKWCKAEAHVGEMSDGEDWYDKEEWGLDTDLKKGQNEDDEDTNAIQGKKTRGRRA